MNQISAKRHLMICLTVLTALVSANVQASASDDDSSPVVHAYQLKGNYNIRSQANQDSQVMSTIGKTDEVGMKFSHVKGDEKWYKVDLDNGGDGYVNRHALKQVELNGNFVIHSDPSLSSHRVGLVSDAKRPEDLVLTGNQKMVQENGKKIEWLEVMSNGKRAWVAGGAANVQTQKSEVKHISQAAEKPVPLPPIRPKPELPKHVQIQQSPAKQPIKVTKKEVTAAHETPAKKDAKPEIKAAPIAAGKPVLKTDGKKILAKDLPARTATASVKLPPVKTPSKPELPVRVPPTKETVAAHPVPPAAIPNVAPAQQAAPKPAPLKSLECASTKSDFMANSRLRAVYGQNYDPFVPWHSWCVDSQPTTGGRWIIDVCIMGRSASPARQVVPVSICYDFAKREAYAMTNNKKSIFKGNDFDHILLGEGVNSITIEREGSKGIVQ